MKTRLLSTCAILCIAPTAALAQTAPDTRTWTVDSVEVTAPRPSFQAPVTATATRTPTEIERIPQSIQALTRTLIEEQDLRTAPDALVNVSGVQPNRTMETVLQAPLIRGFAVGYYYDGLPTYGLPQGTSDPATLINVERLEVAKGPTSTLYGGGTGAPLSGLINVVSRDPAPAFGGSVAIRGGSFGALGGEADVNVPLAPDALTLRINGMYEGADSYIRTIDSRRWAIFPTLAWSPGPDTRIVLRGQFNRLEQREYAGLPAELTIAPGLVIDRNAFAGAENAPRTTVRNTLVTAEVTHRFTDQVSGALAVRRYEGRTAEFATFPLLAFGGTTYAFGSGQLPSSASKTFVTASLAARLGGPAVRHQVLVGTDYDHTRYDGGLGIDFGWGVIDYADPLTNQPFGAAPAISDVQTDRMTSSAVFIQDQVSIGSRFDITAGLRWTRLGVRSRYDSFGFPFANADETYTRFTPRIGATLRVARGVSLFAGYAEGFQGVVAAFGVANPVPETSQSYEAGVKLSAPIHGLSGTIAAYQITRQHVVTADPVNFGLSIQTGEQRARGLEADLVYEPDPALSVLANYAYTEAEVTADNRLPVGDTLRRVPRHAGRLAAHYRFQGRALQGLEVGGGMTAVSRRELTLPNTVSAPGIAVLDAQASWRLGRVTVALSVVNLGGARGFEPYAYLGGAYVIPTQPRSAYLTLRAGF